MAKAKSPTAIEYWKNRTRIQHTIRRLTRQGYIVNYELPDIPKVVTKASVKRLSKITPDVIRQSSVYARQETGEVIPATQAFKEQRSQSAKKAAKTRKLYRERGYDSFANEYLPDPDTISAYNVTKQTAKYFLSKEDIDALLEHILNAPQDARWYPRGIISKQASRMAILKLTAFLSRFRYSEDLLEVDTTETNLNAAIDQTLFGYSEEDVKAGLSAVLAFLNGSPLTAEESKSLEDESEY